MLAQRADVRAGVLAFARSCSGGCGQFSPAIPQAAFRHGRVVLLAKKGMTEQRRCSSASSRRSRSWRSGRRRTTAATTTSRPIRSATGRARSDPRSTRRPASAGGLLSRVGSAQMNPKTQISPRLQPRLPQRLRPRLGRTGADIMVHGDCKSAGCYAMTDGVDRGDLRPRARGARRRPAQLPGPSLSRSA